MSPEDVVGRVRGLGVDAGSDLGIVTARGCVVLAAPAPGGIGGSGAAPIVIEGDPTRAVAAVEASVGPRWVVWSQATALDLAGEGVRLARAWDASVVHRLLYGGWRADPARIWARLHGLSTRDLPTDAPADLFSHAAEDGDPEDPVRPDGHLRPDWVAGDWDASPARMARWVGLLLEVAELQRRALGSLPDPERALRTARSESAAELLCAELAVDGLPVDRAAAEAQIGAYVGPRPRSDQEAAEQRAARDGEVLQHVPATSRWDLRSPGQVKSLLRSVGIEVPDTRAWRLEGLRHEHPLVDALLVWRKAERVATTFGYAWLDDHLGPDGRFRGEWTSCDGAAGRMTASAGLHNMPADLRGGVVAEPGHVFVRADLGQIEPRVLAAVSGDAALALATQDDDLYLPVATALGVDRPTAKVAVLGAMYGQTTGDGARALHRLQAAYPVAMAYLESADRAAQVGTDLRTYGGRLIRMGRSPSPTQAAAQGRYGRNAMVQGAAAELFKVWAVTVRARAQAFDASIVLCLHDELLVHVPARHADAAAALVDDALQEAAARWAPDRSVRFLADTSIIASWSQAKP